MCAQRRIISHRRIRLGPDNAFSLNNQGYLAEMKGDLESAEDFYRQAREAGGAGDRIGIATNPSAEGKKLTSVADQSEGQVSTAIDAVSEAKHRNPAPIQLKRRDGSLVDSTPQPAEPTSPQP